MANNLRDALSQTRSLRHCKSSELGIAINQLERTLTGVMGSATRAARAAQPVKATAQVTGAKATRSAGKKRGKAASQQQSPAPNA